MSKSFQFPLLGSIKICSGNDILVADSFNSLYWVLFGNRGFTRYGTILSIPFIGFIKTFVEWTISDIRNFQFPLLGSVTFSIRVLKALINFQFPLLGSDVRG